MYICWTYLSILKYIIFLKIIVLFLILWWLALCAKPECIKSKQVKQSKAHPQLKTGLPKQLCFLLWFFLGLEIFFSNGHSTKNAGQIPSFEVSLISTLYNLFLVLGGRELLVLALFWFKFKFGSYCSILIQPVSTIPKQSNSCRQRSIYIKDKEFGEFSSWWLCC